MAHRLARHLAVFVRADQGEQGFIAKGVLEQAQGKFHPQNATYGIVDPFEGHIPFFDRPGQGGDEAPVVERDHDHI